MSILSPCRHPKAKPRSCLLGTLMTIAIAWHKLQMPIARQPARPGIALTSKRLGPSKPSCSFCWPRHIGMVRILRLPQCLSLATLVETSPKYLASLGCFHAETSMHPCGHCNRGLVSPKSTNAVASPGFYGPPHHILVPARRSCAYRRLVYHR